jgi:hypothetical protein
MILLMEILKGDYIGSTFDGIIVGVPVMNAYEEMHDEHGMISGINSCNWRYIRSRNVVLWNTAPTNDDKISVDNFLHKRGIENFKHKNMYN